MVFLSICFFAHWFILPKKWRTVFLVLASFYFMALFSVKYAVFFILNAFFIYKVGTSITKSPDKAKTIIKATLTWLIGSLCFFKYSHIVLNSLSALGSHFSITQETTFTKIALPLGVSYIIFRLIHYSVEVYRKSLPEHTFWDLALYVFFFPTFIAGPVDRFRNFYPQSSEEKNLDSSDINYGLFRIISGLVKKFIIADMLSPLIMPILTSPHESPRALVILAVYGLAIQIYMDFSGYTDLAVGIARMFGYRIIENFNYPFFKSNIALFWRNWHMSVYSFIRDYFFLPLFGYRASQLKIYIGIFTTMIVFMLWHELSVSFLVLGIYHGSGLVLWQVFQEVKRKNRGIRKFVDHAYFNPFSTLLTFGFVGLSFIFFIFDIQGVMNILQKMFL